MSAVRRSCQTIARRGEPRVSRSHSRIVSRWLVMPTARSSARVDLRRAPRGWPRAWPARSPRARARPSPAGGSAGRTPGSPWPRSDPSLVDDEGGDAGGAGVDGEDAHAWSVVCGAEDLQDLLVDPLAVGVDAHLVVLGADPGVEVGEPERRAPARSISRFELGGEDDLLLLGRGGQVEVVEVEQPGQLGDGVRVVVDPQVDGDVVEAAVPGALADDEQRGRLAAAAGRRRRRRRRSARRAGGGPSGASSSVASHAASMASTTSSPARMLPWMA